MQIDSLSLLLTSGEYELARTVCKVNCATGNWQKTVDALISVFHAYGCAVPLISKLLIDEVQNTSSATELFRSTTPASRAIGSFFRSCGADYLRATLGKCVTELAALKESEVVASSDDSVDHGTSPTLIQLVERTLNSDIFTSMSAMPPVLRDLLHGVRVAVAAKFPQWQLRSVGAFLFVRYLVPALASPATFSLITEAPETGTRRFVLASALVQKLANGVTPRTATADEAAFYARNTPNMVKFLDEVSAKDPSPCVPFMVSNDPKVLGNIAVLRDNIATHFDALCSALAERAAKVDLSKLADAVGVQSPLKRAMCDQRHSKPISLIQASAGVGKGSAKSPMGFSSGLVTAPPVCLPPDASSPLFDRRNQQNLARMPVDVPVNPAKALTKHSSENSLSSPRSMPSAMSIASAVCSKPVMFSSPSSSSQLVAKPQIPATNSQVVPVPEHQQQASQKRSLLDARQDVTQYADQLFARVKDAERQTLSALGHNRVERRRIEDENTLLLGELQTLLKRYNATPSSLAAQCIRDPRSKIDFAAVSEESNSAIEAFWRKYDTTMELIDIIKHHMDVVEDLNETIYLAKYVKMLHTFMQMPLDHRFEPQPIPRHWDTTNVTSEKLQPLRLATVHALDEMQRGINDLTRNIEPIFHLLAIDQRLTVLASALNQAIA